ncbi:MAG: hypothetical protein GXP39_05210 [Chloroflexi bacterium]|nr:hypothetical protein [Chloroflexota bacterium]
MRGRSAQVLVDWLNKYADGLVRGESQAISPSALPPELADEARSLMELTDVLAATLKPVRPRPSYREHLHQGLIQAAQRKQTQRALARRHVRVSRRQWMLGAAAVGSAVSVLGVVAYLLRNRHNDQAGQAIPG